MKINNRTNSIEMTAKFAKSAAKFGTEEYNNLQIARKDYPNYRVVIVSRKPAAKRDTYKGLTYDYMEMYIQKHDDEKQSIMAEYKMLRGLSDEAKEVLAESCTYLEMREWFLAKFPAIANFHEARAKLLAS